MRHFRVSCCPLVIWFVAMLLPRPATATQVVLTVTGTVDAGVDGNPNDKGSGKVFGADADLSGKPFTLTITFDTGFQGDGTSSSCSDGTVFQSSNRGTNKTRHPWAILKIADQSYQFAALRLLGLSWNVDRQAHTSCSGHNEIGFGWTETYTGPYVGSAGFGSIDLYASNSAAFNGDWRTSILQIPVGPVDFYFGISISQVGSPNPIEYANGYLKPANVQVKAIPPCTQIDAILQATLPDGTRQIPMTWVKNTAQAIAWSEATGTIVAVGQQIPVPVPPGADPGEEVNYWASQSTLPFLTVYAKFYDYWDSPQHDYKNNDIFGACRPLYDAYGNFMYGATGNAAGIPLDVLLAVANVRHGGPDAQNNPINSFDIGNGFNIIAKSWTLGIVTFNKTTTSP